MTAYAGYSESNRAPTAGELSCADADSPCLLDAFLVSDPNLKQVISRTIEAGVRGHVTDGALPGALQWNVGAFRTTNSNDIVLLATDINGFGYFDNVGTTRRQGLEAGLSWKVPQWSLSLNYSLVRATYQENLTLASDSPAADDDGNIQVSPGDRIPLNPEHRVTAAVDYAPIEALTVGVDARFNQQPVPGRR